MKPEIYRWSELDGLAMKTVMQRPSSSSDSLEQDVSRIIELVRQDGDAALKSLTQQLDGCDNPQLTIGIEMLTAALEACPDSLVDALTSAGEQIERFHRADLPQATGIETITGMRCESRYEPIETVGLYIPGGTAPLVSTVLMLGIPAKIAGCTNVVVCTPPGSDGKVPEPLLAAIVLCGIEKAYAVGGAQAIAAMAYGTESIPACDKIFGPGNAWVTEAKQQVARDPLGAAIDMPAGPSEVLVIADDSARPESVAWDLLSQAEHGPDSQVILITNSVPLSESVSGLISELAVRLPRREVLEQSLRAARIIVVDAIEQAVKIASDYAPEHLIINSRDARVMAGQVRNAGSIFIGPWTPESLGDYCSGTNHVLPTYGWARSHSALSVSDFMRRFTVQEASFEALKKLGATVETLAGVEGLEAHRMAVKSRLDGEQP